MAPPLPIARTAAGVELQLLPALANRHGLIAGATGTGKTVTLQLLADRFSAIGVPVCVADVKGALPGAKTLQGAVIPDEGPLYQLLEGFEKRIIEDHIKRFDGNMSKAAEDLGLERSHLYKKVRRLGIQT